MRLITFCIAVFRKAFPLTPQQQMTRMVVQDLSSRNASGTVTMIRKGPSGMPEKLQIMGTGCQN